MIIYKKPKPVSTYPQMKPAYNSEVKAVNNFSMQNTQLNNSNASTKQNFSSHARIIDNYNDGTPSDTSYMYTTPTDNIFFSTKIDPETNQKISNKPLTPEQRKFYQNKITTVINNK
jgi:hypothetical protein